VNAQGRPAPAMAVRTSRKAPPDILLEDDGAAERLDSPPATASIGARPDDFVGPGLYRSMCGISPVFRRTEERARHEGRSRIYTPLGSLPWWSSG